MPDIVQTWVWPVRLTSTGAVEQQVQEARFGDGYVQRSEVGINNERQQWEIQVTGREELVREVRAFLRAHRGARSFLWTPPLEEEPSFFTSQGGWRISGHGLGRFTLTTTFVQTFKP
ncbi:MAG: phage tail protein [Alcanivorax sp.]|nr:phage tail protein [Alcanivorax sp.]MAY11907.1 phage tail protein [Alcanivorax sp.]MBI56777.1 phage tail protein [Alcanivorax sp.]MBM1145644.1 phage tail protein [Alcanivorax sp. ZXX171]|tara:strand:- start:13418 stop:13768 length:351 start_codon:yes stop_codon:yes gene_type:complete